MFQNKRTKPNKIIFLGGLVLFFCLFSLFVSSALAMARRPQNNTTTIKGRVADQLTQKKIIGASIKISTFTGKTIFSTTSDKNGNYEIKSKNLSGLYFIRAYTIGYNLSVLLRYLKPGQTYTFNFSLKPLPPNNSPKIISMSPKDHSTLVTGDTLTITINAQDLDKDQLQYRYIMDNTVIRSWTNSSAHSLKTINSDRGRHRIRVEVRDNRDGFVSKTVDIYIFRSFPKPGN